ncbi:MAG TPA: PLP-dependent transferase, partial [Patescibacteria group bacterium]|nr:PLP-dependent transferase [Patescibacteria group bacterium]
MTGLPTPTPETYGSEAALTESLQRKGTPNPGEGLYPRDGVATVEEIEHQVSAVTLGTQAHNVIMASGMSAVREAVLFAADLKGPHPKIAYGDDLYSQSSIFFRKLENMGIDTLGFDSGGKQGTAKALGQEADVVFAETVANGPNIPVLDIHYLLEAI